MASAVTSAQVTQPHFQSICRHLLLRLARTALLLPHLPSKKCSVLPVFGVLCVRVSSPAPCLLIPPNPSQPAMVGNLSPMCHAHDEQSFNMHWCHQMGYLSGRTQTLLTHICACPTLRRWHTGQTEVIDMCFPSPLNRNGRWFTYRSSWLGLSGVSSTPSPSGPCPHFSGVGSLLGQLYMVPEVFLKAKNRQPPCSPQCPR